MYLAYLSHSFLNSGFRDSSVGKESTCNAGDPNSVPRLGRSARKGIGYALQYSWTSLVAQLVKNLPVNVGDRIRSLGLEDPLEKETAPYICLKNIMDREV